MLEGGGILLAKILRRYLKTERYTFEKLRKTRERERREREIFYVNRKCC